MLPPSTVLTLPKTCELNPRASLNVDDTGRESGFSHDLSDVIQP